MNELIEYLALVRLHGAAQDMNWRAKWGSLYPTPVDIKTRRAAIDAINAINERMGSQTRVRLPRPLGSTQHPK